MGKSKDLATLKSGLSIDGTLETTSVGTNLTSNSYNIVRVQTDKDDTGGADGILQFTHGSSNTVKGEIRYDASESMFEFGHGDNQGHVRIDSSGHVTIPNQPSFGVYRNAGAVTANNVYVFNGYDYNTGTMYNTNNGRGTAPVSGRYFVSTWMMCETNQEYTNYNYHIRKNGTTYKSVYSSNGGSGRHMQWSWAGTMGLAANDYIDIFTNNIRLYGSSHLYSAFCMHLLS